MPPVVLILILAVACCFCSVIGGLGLWFFVLREDDDDKGTSPAPGPGTAGTPGTTPGTPGTTPGTPGIAGTPERQELKQEYSKIGNHSLTGMCLEKLAWNDPNVQMWGDCDTGKSTDCDIVMRQCDNSNGRQQWGYIKQSPLHGRVQLSSAMTAKGFDGVSYDVCINGGTSNSGKPALAMPCAGAGRDGSWWRHDDKSRLKIYEGVYQPDWDKTSGMCLDVDNGRLVVNPCNDSASQKWKNV